MLSQFLQLLFIMPLFLVPLLLYKRSYRFMTRFYLLMLSTNGARKLYVQMLVVVLLLYHYVYVSCHFGEWGVLPSTILCAFMFRHQRTKNWLHMLHEDWRRFFIVALCTIVIGIIPHLTTLAVTLGYLLLAALFFPSYRALTKWNEQDIRNLWRGYPTVLAEHYY